MKGKERTLFYFAAYQLGVNPDRITINYIFSEDKLSYLDKLWINNIGINIVGIETRSDLKCRIMEIGLEYMHRKRNSSIRRIGKAVDRLVYHVLKYFKLK